MIHPALSARPEMMRKKLLTLLLNSLKNEALKGGCTKENSSLVDCVDFLLHKLEGQK